MTHRRKPAHWATLVTSFATVVLIGCSDPTAVDVWDGRQSLQASMVSTTLASALDGEGHFRSQYLTLPTDGVDEATAVEVSAAFVKTNLFPFHESLERQAGRAIDFDALMPTRAIFAETPYEALPQHHPAPIRAAAGPKYIVTFADQSGPAVAVSVSVHVRDFRVSADGTLEWPRTYGNQFRSVGINQSVGGGLPVSPEAIVAEVWKTTGAKTVSPPVFVWSGAGFAPTIGAWRLILDRPVDVDDSHGRTTATTVLYVDGRGHAFAPSGGLETSFVQAPVGATAVPRSALGGELVRGTIKAHKGELR